MRKTLGIIALIAGIAYVAVPFDVDVAWYGYIDDFFAFMAAYTFFMASRNRSMPTCRLLQFIAGSFFILAMLSLIALLIIVA